MLPCCSTAGATRSLVEKKQKSQHYNSDRAHDSHCRLKTKLLIFFTEKSTGNRVATETIRPARDEIVKRYDWAERRSFSSRVMTPPNAQ